MNDPDPLSILAAFGAAEAPGSGPALDGIMLAVAGFVLFLLLNAFFAASEFALMKVRESQLHAGEGVPARTRKKLARARKAAKHPIFIWLPVRRALLFLPWRWDSWERFLYRN